MLIQDIFFNDIRELEKLIDRDLSSWYNDYI